MSEAIARERPARSAPGTSSRDFSRPEGFTVTTTIHRGVRNSVSSPPSLADTPLTESFRCVETELRTRNVSRHRTPGIRYGDDGSLTRFVQRHRPTDAVEAANWLPSPHGPFTVIIRA